MYREEDEFLGKRYSKLLKKNRKTGNVALRVSNREGDTLTMSGLPLALAEPSFHSSTHTNARHDFMCRNRNFCASENETERALSLAPPGRDKKMTIFWL